jgi:hypothetical protein
MLMGKLTSRPKDYDEKLTLEWIISTLRKSGINSKKIVIDRLENASEEDLYILQNSIYERQMELFRLERLGIKEEK